MEEDNTLRSPIKFNCWKHHAGFIKEQIKIFSKKRDIILLNKHLLKIGESQMDLYSGRLMPPDISKQIISHLKIEKNLERNKYISWLNNNGGDYKLVKLSDKSIKLFK